MTQEETAKRLIQLFDGNADHAIKCVNEIINDCTRIQAKYVTDYWKPIIEIIKKQNHGTSSS